MKPVLISDSELEMTDPVASNIRVSLYEKALTSLCVSAS